MFIYEKLNMYIYIYEFLIDEDLLALISPHCLQKFQTQSMHLKSLLK